MKQICIFRPIHSFIHAFIHSFLFFSFFAAVDAAAGRPHDDVGLQATPVRDPHEAEEEAKLPPGLAQQVPLPRQED